MTASSWAGVITAFATLITAVGGLVVTFKIMIPNKKVNEETHVIVNQQRTDMMKVIEDQGNWNRALARSLRQHGIEVPIDQSLPDEEKEMEKLSNKETERGPAEPT